MFIPEPTSRALHVNKERKKSKNTTKSARNRKGMRRRCSEDRREPFPRADPDTRIISEKTASRKYEVQPAVPDQVSQNLDQASALLGVSHLPESPERKIASITAMFLSASSSETGTSASPRTALEKTSP
jgi:hypothetical protein